MIINGTQIRHRSYYLIMSIFREKDVNTVWHKRYRSISDEMYNCPFICIILIRKEKHRTLKALQIRFFQDYALVLLSNAFEQKYMEKLENTKVITGVEKFSFDILIIRNSSYITFFTKVNHTYCLHSSKCVKIMYNAIRR